MTTFRKLPGFPSDGSEVFPIGAGGSRGSWSGHSEGAIVEFESTGPGAKWAGNFQPGHGGWEGIVSHPDDVHVLVITKGQGYLVNPSTKAIVDRLTGIQCVLDLPGLLVISDGITLRAIGNSGTRWQSNRIAWDEIRNLRVVDGVLTGEASGPGDGTWSEFSLNLETGAVSNSYYEKTMQRSVEIIKD